MTVLFKIHYFLWYGGHTSIFGYESVYARYYTNATTVQFGTLRLILPFLAVLVTPIVCLNADRRRKHRLYFTVSLMVALFSLMAYTALPLTMLIDEHEPTTNIANLTSGLPNRTLRTYRWVGLASMQPPAANHDSNNEREQQGLWVGPFVYYCMISMLFELALTINTCLSDSYAVLQAEEGGTTFGRIIVWGTFGWAFSALVLSFINRQAIIARLLPGLLFGVGLLTIDSILISLWPRAEDFKLDMISTEAARSLTGSSSSGHRDPTDYMPLNEANRINMGTEVTTKSKQETKLRRRRRFRRLSEISVHPQGTPASDLLVVGQIDTSPKVTTPRSPLNTNPSSPVSVSPRSPLSLQFNSPIAMSPRSPIDGGADRDINQKSTMSSAIKTINSDCTGPNVETNQEPPEVADPFSRKTIAPSPYETMIDLTKLAESLKSPRGVDLNSLVSGGGGGGASGEQTPPLTASLKIQLSLFYLILKQRKSLVRFLVMFVLSGLFMSMQWNFFFLYLEDTYRKDFELISALSMVGQSILGELPFFILSRRIIDKFGRSHTLSISMMSMGIRFLLYRFMLRPETCMYFVFLADCLQGPNYGLFYVVMTEVGLEYSYCNDSILDQLVSMKLLDGANRAQVDVVRLALRSTVQSVAFACYEGLGVGLGGLIGGIILQHRGFDTLWSCMAVCSITLGLINCSIELLCRENDLSADFELSKTKRDNDTGQQLAPTPAQPQHDQAQM